MKTILYIFSMAVLTNLLLSGCSVFDRGSQSLPMVKLRCSQQNHPKPEIIDSTRQKQFSDKDSKIIPFKQEIPLLLNPVKSIANYLLSPSISSKIPNIIPIKSIIKRISRPIVKHDTKELKAKEIKHQNQICETKDTQDGELGIIALISSVLGIILLLSSITSTGFLSFSVDGTLLAIGLFLCIFSIILAIIGLSNGETCDQVLSAIVLIFWLNVLFLILIFSK